MQVRACAQQGANVEPASLQTSHPLLDLNERYLPRPDVPYDSMVALEREEVLRVDCESVAPFHPPRKTLETCHPYSRPSCPFLLPSEGDLDGVGECSNELR